MNEKISLQEIVDAVVKKTNNTKIFTNDYIHELLNVIKEGLQKDGHVNISGLGIFKIKWVKTQNRRNPQNGANIVVPAHNKVSFQPEKKMKEYVNRRYSHLKPKEILTTENKPKIEKKQKTEVIKKVVIDTKINKVNPPENKNINKQSEKKKASPIVPIIGVIITSLIIIVLILIINKSCNNTNYTPSVPELSIVDSTDIDTTTNVTETKPVKKENPISQKQYIETSIIHTVVSGNTLWGLANKYYGNAPLWPNIYRKNIETIVKPDIIYTGINIEIPNLEGSGHNLTKIDSFNIAEGYYLSYLAYKKYDEKKASNFLRIAKRFRTTIVDSMK